MEKQEGNYSPKNNNGIMVSSTFSDMVELRKKLLEMLPKYGFKPNAMENDFAKPEGDIIESSLNMVRESAAYIGIITHKYGTIYKDDTRNPDGLSLTELEFNEALKLKCPILLFIMGSKYLVLVDDVETDASKIEKLKKFRERAKIKSEDDTNVPRIFSEFNDINEFKDCVQLSLANLQIKFIDNSEKTIQTFGENNPIKEFWGLDPSDQIDIICSEIPSELLQNYANIKDQNYLRYAKFADLDTLIYLKSNISKLYPACNVNDFFREQSVDDISHRQQFIIGGPSWNSMYKNYQDELPFSFEENESGENGPLCFIKDGTKLLPYWKNDDKLNHVISVYTRLFNNRSIIHLLSGYSTFGVLGSAKAFFDSNIALDNIKWLKEAKVKFDRNFSIIFSTKVNGTFSKVSIIEKSKFYCIFQQDDKDNDKWRLVEKELNLI